jgi:hypothetical protein
MPRAEHNAQELEVCSLIPQTGFDLSAYSGYQVSPF